MNLETYQRGLQSLISQGHCDAFDAPYLRGLIGSPRLAVVNEVIRFWRLQTLERFCVLTAGLLKRRGRFEQDVARFLRSGEFSPFIEEAGQQFLRFMAADADATVAALAHTELALHATRTDPRREQVVDWPCEPENVLAQALGRADVASPAPGRYRMRIGRALPSGYQCERL